MRTTVTLDDDLAAHLEQLARERSTSFKQVLNETLRKGLRPRADEPDYRLPTFRLGLRPGIDLDRALGLAADLEDDEVVRRLELRK